MAEEKVRTQDADWDFKPLKEIRPISVPAYTTPNYPVDKYHLRQIYVQGMKGVVRIEVQRALEQQAVQHSIDLYLFTLEKLDEVMGLIFDLYYNSGERLPIHQQQLKHFIEVSLGNLMQHLSAELLAKAFQRITSVAATALLEEPEDLPSFFDRLLGRR